MSETEVSYTFQTDTKLIAYVDGKQVVIDLTEGDTLDGTERAPSAGWFLDLCSDTSLVEGVLPDVHAIENAQNRASPVTPRPTAGRVGVSTPKRRAMSESVYRTPPMEVDDDIEPVPRHPSAYWESEGLKERVAHKASDPRRSVSRTAYEEESGCASTGALIARLTLACSKDATSPAGFSLMASRRCLAMPPDLRTCCNPYSEASTRTPIAPIGSGTSRRRRATSEAVRTTATTPSSLRSFRRGISGSPAQQAVTPWTPPRRKLLMHIPPPGTLDEQGHSCHGCGASLSGWMKGKPRYCEYYGKFFCSKCHGGQYFVIPSRMLWEWDAAPRPCSRSAISFLTGLVEEPAFDISAINSDLYVRCEEMKKLQGLRHELRHIADFVTRCDRGHELLLATCGGRMHLVDDSELYSLKDLVAAKSGTLRMHLLEVKARMLRHVMAEECTSCRARGFVCPTCPDDRMIFPFFTDDTMQCPVCSRLFHLKCFLSEGGAVGCPLCVSS